MKSIPEAKERLRLSLENLDETFWRRRIHLKRHLVSNKDQNAA